MTDQTDPAALVKERGPNWEGFCRDLLDEWPTRDIDGFELFDAALRNGLICEIPGGYDPEQHIDAEGICPERGDPWYEYAFGERLTVIDAKALVKAALKAAMKLANVVEYADRPAWANTGSWCHAVELYGMRIRALADDPEEVAGIIEQVKGESDE